MCGWSRRDAASASRTNRRRKSGTTRSSGRGTLSATGRPQDRIHRQEDDPEAATAQLALDREASEPAGERAAGRNAPRPDRLQQALALLHGVQEDAPGSLPDRAAPAAK